MNPYPFLLTVKGDEPFEVSDELKKGLLCQGYLVIADCGEKGIYAAVDNIDVLDIARVLASKAELAQAAKAARSIQILEAGSTGEETEGQREKRT